MKYKHTNVSKHIIKINDMKSNTYLLKPGKYIVIDKNSSKPGIVMEQIVSEKKPKKVIKKEIKEDE